MADNRIITIAADIAMHKLHNAPAKSLKGGVPMRVRFMTSGKRVSTMEGHGLVELFGLEIRVRRLPKGLAVRTVRQHHVLQQRHAAETECVSPHAPPDPRKLPVPVGKALNQGAGAINKKQTRIPSQGLFARQPGVQVLAELLE